MKTFDIIINGIPVGQVQASNALEARQIARADEALNEDSLPIEFIWAECI